MAGTTNLSLTATVTASSYLAGYETAKAADGDATSTRWAGELFGSTYQWWAIDAGSAVSPDTIVLVCFAGPAVTFAVDYSSDGVAWTEMAEFTVQSPTDTDATYTIGIQAGAGGPRLIDGFNGPLIDGGLIQ